MTKKIIYYLEDTYLLFKVYTASGNALGTCLTRVSDQSAKHYYYKTYRRQYTCIYIIYKGINVIILFLSPQVCT